MKAQFQTIRTLIQDSETLSEEKKIALLESLKKIEKEMDIISFKLDRTEKVKRTTEILLQETIEELEQKRNAVEDTLTELKATQAQLIHSEKMASLGELTAGIAHEIQNPLNFVNNFAEVSADLVDELHEEANQGDINEVKAIADDLKQNLEKIVHHGKRASGIVKGMLEHSRSRAGEKTLTDLNSLADEYLRLSFHGLRARDKSFNADFKSVLDPDCPKIEAVAADIGRVLLNMFNNAFYAVHEKSKRQIVGYNPEVVLTTKKLASHVEISVTDNGSGIPNDIKEKIFQPFFTTKPTGEGTGLGLSLSYDIITKGHGGSIHVKSTLDQGTEFIILLPILN